jgi:REP element-mobilizing transposase RayT
MFGRIIVGDAPLRVPHCVLSEYGAFVDEQIKKINTIYSYVSVANYVIMPNHIHLIVLVEDGTRRGASPTKAVIPQIIQSLKSMTTKQFGFNMWQRSFHDHIIRTEAEYIKIWHYIDENPERWMDDCYYCGRP